jgi:hypothetical protein
VLDEVKVPEALRATFWRSISDPSSYDAEFDAILHAIFGTSARPPLGQPPVYSTAVTIPELTPASSALLVELAHVALDHGDYMLNASAWIHQAGDAAGLTEDALDLELHRLERAEYIELPRAMGGPRISHLTISPMGLYVVLVAEGFDVDAARNLVVSALVNDGLRTYPDLASATQLAFLQLDIVSQLLGGATARQGSPLPRRLLEQQGRQDRPTPCRDASIARRVQPFGAASIAKSDLPSDNSISQIRSAKLGAAALAPIPKTSLLTDG